MGRVQYSGLAENALSEHFLVIFSILFATATLLTFYDQTGYILSDIKSCIREGTKEQSPEVTKNVSVDHCYYYGWLGSVVVGRRGFDSRAPAGALPGNLGQLSLPSRWGR